MQRIKLLRSFNENRAGDIIEVSVNVAHGLVESKIATYDLYETKEMRADKPSSKKKKRYSYNVK